LISELPRRVLLGNPSVKRAGAVRPQLLCYPSLRGRLLSLSARTTVGLVTWVRARARDGSGRVIHRARRGRLSTSAYITPLLNAGCGGVGSYDGRGCIKAGRGTRTLGRLLYGRCDGRGRANRALTAVGVVCAGLPAWFPNRWNRGKRHECRKSGAYREHHYESSHGRSPFVCAGLPGLE
jgi:hypothetical protein